MRRLHAMLLATIAVGFTLVGFAGFASPARAAAPMSLRLIHGMNAANVHAWVFFRDKDVSPAQLDRSLVGVQAALTQRALWRRSKTMKAAVVDVMDLPVSGRYMDQVLATGATRRAVTRWLNGMSVSATPDQLRRIAQLPCVDHLDLVERYVRPPEATPQDIFVPTQGTAGPGRARPEGVGAIQADSTQYGVSWKQLKQIQVTQMHDAGYHGEGMLICMLDDGYVLTHSAFNYAGHPLQVAAKRDFINGDTVVSNQAGQDQNGQDQHGTWTLSTIGGYYPGRFLGAAYEARFILGKTEVYPTESHIEEDYWLMGSEWADSLGADVISSSLAYRTMDDTSTSYHFWNFDGKQTIIARACEIAAYRGIVVVNAMGNDGQLSGNYPDPLNKLSTPADCDSMISSGAVDSAGHRASFSSIGPTYDRRIKPDIMARGVNDWTVSYSNSAAYNQLSGTSFSTPLTAGAVALLLQRRPYYTPSDVIAAIHATGTQASNPDTMYGWGLLHIYDAMNYPLPAAVGPPGGPSVPVLSITQSRPNPFRATTRIQFALGESAAAGTVDLSVFDVSGRRVATLLTGHLSAGPHEAAWDGRTSSGQPAAPGVYFARLSAGDQTATRRLVHIQ